MSVSVTDRKAALAEEYNAHRQALLQGDAARAWQHLERAHIIAQPVLREHLRSHWLMLRLALRERDGAEVAGQAMRLVLAVPGNLSGRLPIGNIGRARVNAFRQMPVPPDLRKFVP
ncbi:MAG: DUF3703 domain-containing protein [Erythrobacter sp.]|nr:DUF3703 domain-containing protein [Erythrobacter sp.]